MQATWVFDGRSSTTVSAPGDVLAPSRIDERDSGNGVGQFARNDRPMSILKKVFPKGDTLLVWFCKFLSYLPLLALLGIVGELFFQALPSIKVSGFGFFTTSDWKPGSSYANPISTSGVMHPPGAHFGIVPLIVGTISTSLIAIVIAVPVSIGAAIIIVEKLPAKLSGFLGLSLEVLAGVPSVVFGLWGVLVLGPFLSHHITPFISKHAPNVPVLNIFKGPTGAGEGLLTSGLVLSLMIIPIIASTCRELFRQVPVTAREGARALGMTDYEVVRKVDIPWVSSGIIGASVLGLGRALGETMAVAMISGSVTGTFPANIYSTMSTIAATIVSQLDSALTDSTNFFVSSLAEAGLVLLAMSLMANLFARFLVKRVSGTALPVGRGV